MSASPISNVSDTARWVAVYRAWESARPDALFHDPYAELLAGERGHAIAAVMPRQARNGWPLIARTKLVDDIVQTAIAGGCNGVLNLAAGLDTRPYRLKLPASLEWIEADLPAIIEEKERLLASAQPRCRLRRIKVDLKDPAARVAMLREAPGPATQTLVITEGLLVYLDDAEVRALAGDLLAEPNIRWWLIDLASPAIVKMMQQQMGAHLANAPMKFAPPNGVGFFEAIGWKVADVWSIMGAAAKFRRLPWMLRLFAMLPDPDPRMLESARWSGVVKLERT
ncbi:MAG TPA: class I SAM-dependent methyltransferase [Steroidobacteraceae bacterium]|nr:class I SAM-dependent methyltransferase [Steroidobacteraceae bacterium]